MTPQIAIEHIIEISQEIKRINAIHLEEIEWTYNREVIDIPPETIEAFGFTGLNNIDFAILQTQEIDLTVSSK